MSEVPFCGRQHELAFLNQQFDLAHHHGSRLALLSAPAGMGKTALCMHFGRQLSEPTHFLSGRGWDNRAAVPYYALLEALTPIYQHHTTSLESTNPYLEAFFTQIERRDPEPVPTTLLFYGLSELLLRTANEPLCILLDDLQWVDEGTLEWIDFALHELSTVPILWIGTYRSEETASLTTFLMRSERWMRNERMAEYSLLALPLLQTEQIARSIAPHYPWDATSIKALHERSGGMPLLTIEEARTWEVDKAQRPQGQALIRYKLARLGEEDREMMYQAAIIGEQFHVEPLATALDKDSFAIARALNRLTGSAAWLVAEKNGFRFAHNRYREALLGDLSQPLRRMYHARLASEGIALPSSERAYHLIHSGQIQQGTQALLCEGDRAREQLAWRDALRYYQEAALQIRDRAEETDIRCTIYERMGDVHLNDTQEPEIARGYYEAAMRWAETPHARTLLLCRMAETYKATPRAMHYLEEAARWIARAEDPSLRDWIELRLMTFAPHRTPSAEDRQRAYILARRATQRGDLPRDLAIRAHQATSWMTGVLLDEREIERQTLLLETLPTNSWSRIQHLSNLIQTYRGCGRIAEAAGYAREALTIADRLGQQPIASGLYGELGLLLLNMGRFDEAKEICLKGLDRPISTADAFFLYQLLCMSWPSDCDSRGLEWARGLLESTRHSFAHGTRPARMWLHQFGGAERIFSAEGRCEEFRNLMDAIATQASADQSQILHYPSTASSILSLTTHQDKLTWHYTKGNDRAEAFEKEKTWTFRALPIQGFSHMDMPRTLSNIEGDFVLQATIHGGQQVQTDTLAAWQQVGRGEKCALAAGGGGLLVCRDQRNALRLFAHTCNPGDVVFEVRQNSESLTSGRGFMGMGPLRLRLEKVGTRFSAYAAQENGPWYSCGQIDLPTWNEIDVGLYGENVVALYPALVERAETRFKDVYLQAVQAAPMPPTPREAEHPLNEPNFAPDFPDMIAQSAPMHRILEHVRRQARSNASVLIQGETGTGKELVARALHRLSERSDGPFIALNCAAIASELLERELFGHMRGAFTGAYENRGGLFEAADGGVLFLDEIGEATPAFQARLLRVLEDGAVRRVGAQSEQRVNVRVVAASNRDLAAMVSEGLFRQDLYYRLRGAIIELPPLRKRRADIEPLVAHGLCQWAQQRDRAMPTISTEALAALRQHNWPGNVRELIHAVEQAAEEADGQTIHSRHLSIAAPHPPTPLGADESNGLLVEALRQSRGNISAAARQLGISRPTLYRRLRELGVRAVDYK